jgi:Fe-S oxidoreductase
MRNVFAPGCALMMYKPHLAHRITAYLNETGENKAGEAVTEHHICCHHDPRLAQGTRVINVCAGCDRRFRSLYEGVSTISLWEVLAKSDTFLFPDYRGKRMAVHDACPTRTEKRVHDAVRTLLSRMNIEVTEPEHTREKAVCCGDSFYGVLPADEVKERMKIRAGQMPCEDVAVYCVSCIKAMHIGGKRPRYLVDLLFGEETDIGTFEPDEWHKELKAYIEAH